MWADLHSQCQLQSDTNCKYSYYSHFTAFENWVDGCCVTVNVHFGSSVWWKSPALCRLLILGELNVKWLRNRFHEAPDEKLSSQWVTNEIIVTDREQCLWMFGQSSREAPQRIFFVPKFKHTQFLMTEQMISQEITIALIMSTNSDWWCYIRQTSLEFLINLMT